MVKNLNLSFKIRRMQPIHSLKLDIPILPHLYSQNTELAQAGKQIYLMTVKRGRIMPL